jgi:hypothetical protein
MFDLVGMITNTCHITTTGITMEQGQCTNTEPPENYDIAKNNTRPSPNKGIDKDSIKDTRSYQGDHSKLNLSTGSCKTISGDISATIRKMIISLVRLPNNGTSTCLITI